MNDPIDRLIGALPADIRDHMESGLGLVLRYVSVQADARPYHIGYDWRMPPEFGDGMSIIWCPETGVMFIGDDGGICRMRERPSMTGMTCSSRWSET